MLEKTLPHTQLFQQHTKKTTLNYDQLQVYPTIPHQQNNPIIQSNQQ